MRDFLCTNPLLAKNGEKRVPITRAEQPQYLETPEGRRVAYVNLLTFAQDCCESLRKPNKTYEVRLRGLRKAMIQKEKSPRRKRLPFLRRFLGKALSAFRFRK